MAKKIKHLEAWRLARWRKRSYATPEEIRVAREKAGLSISDAAALLAVSESTIRNWEHDRTRCPVVYWEFLMIVTYGTRFDARLRDLKVDLVREGYWGVDREFKFRSRVALNQAKVSP
ncbi:helix-turn-helix domain-containing protein [Chitinimonas lacunae]|uniref:Helix-turn-helix domain-containing protein n=1 Tax=Chitinimonas lacunae TaxID=1963018 RepID=A0ABV8MNN0_9NEIS